METPEGSPPASSDDSAAASAAVSWEPPEDLEIGPAPGYQFGGAGERLLAYIVDSLIILGLLIVVLLIGAVIFAALPGLAIVIWIVGCLVVFLGYFPYFWVRNGQTPGLKLFQLHVVRDRDGGPVGVGSAILRLIGLYIIDGLVFYLGFVWIFIDKRRRCWHDLLAGTVVVRKAA